MKTTRAFSLPSWGFTSPPLPVMLPNSCLAIPLPTVTLPLHPQLTARP